MQSQSFECDPPIINKPVLVPPLYFQLSILAELHARTEPHILENLVTYPIHSRNFGNHVTVRLFVRTTGKPM